MADQLLKLGDYSKPRPKGYYFDLYEWVEPIVEAYDTSIDPKDYFITSGEAVTKCTVLELDLWKHYGSLLCDSLNALSEEFEQPVQALREGELFWLDRELQLCLTRSWRGACQARHLVIHLTEARGAHLFLETDWSEGQVVCYPKNPRGVKF